jgi:uncharacterized protein
VSHFLAPLLRRDAAPVALVNERTGVVVASRLEAAVDAGSRNRGLMGRESLDDGHALVLAPCWAVHTWNMRFAIDILFASRDGRVLKTAVNVRPRRIRAAMRAFATIEMRAGSLVPSGVLPGDRLRLASASDCPVIL